VGGAKDARKDATATLADGEKSQNPENHGLFNGKVAVTVHWQVVKGREKKMR